MYEIDFIKTGESVVPGTPNRPLSQLSQQLENLFNLYKSSRFGEALFLFDATVDPDVKIGMPLYYNSNNNRFEATVLSVTTGEDNSRVSLADSAIPWGVLSKKKTSITGDILVFGSDSVDIRGDHSGVNPGGVVPSATWYLSSSPGHVRTSPSDVSVPVFRTLSNGKIFILPIFHEQLLNRPEYSFRLFMYPSGTVSMPAEGDPHVITNPSEAIPGWLPVSHPSIAGIAPAGAFFGYNLSAHSALAAVFPPVRPENVVIRMQRSSHYDLNRRFYGQVLYQDMVVVDANGVWWMTNSFDQVPWPTDLDNTNPLIPPNPSDPQYDDYVLKMVFNDVLGREHRRGVNTLKSGDSRIQVVCPLSGEPAVSGDLEIRFESFLEVDAEDTPGYKVLKSVNSDLGTFQKGPVTSGVYAVSSNIQLVGNEKSLTSNGLEIFRGDVGIRVTEAGDRAIPASIVKLQNVTEEANPILYLGMSNNFKSSYTAKFNIGADFTSGLSLKFVMRLLGKVNGTFPNLDVEYVRVPKPGAILTPVSLPDISGVAIPMTTSVAVTANQIVEAVSSSFIVEPGDIVYLTVTRDPEAGGDNYSGEIGVLQQFGQLTIAGESPLPPTLISPPLSGGNENLEELFDGDLVSQLAQLNFVRRDGLNWVPAFADNQNSLAQFIIDAENRPRRRGWFLYQPAGLVPGDSYRLEHDALATPQFTNNYDPVSGGNPGGIDDTKPLQPLFLAVTSSLIYLDISV